MNSGRSVTASPAAILERIHFLRHDVGGLAHRPREHRGRFEHRHFDALEAVQAAHAVERRDDRVEAVGLLAEQALHAANGLGGLDFRHMVGLAPSDDAATRASLRPCPVKYRALALSFALPFLLASPAAVAQNSAPQPLPIVPTHSRRARDVAYPGTMQLEVDATDIARIDLQGARRPSRSPQPGRMTLQVPQWLPGHHGPDGEIDKIAGL